MKQKLLQSHCIFPCNDILKTADFYEQVLGFHAVRYLHASEPHVCLYRDDTEIILTKTNNERVLPNRLRYGYGYDAYFITFMQEELQQEFLDKGAKIVRPLSITDYQNKEFVLEDIDGRHIAFGIKQK
jgi:catechol 2,3-dioxygenase-like lactoylglutathione lyase family enzyme